MITAPSLFISHGAPTFALEPGRAGAALSALGRSLATPRAVLVVSAHWISRDVLVSGTAQPQTIHDFGGFPRELYRLQYPAPGAPQLAAETARLLAGAGWHAGLDDERGLDHGAWVPLMHLLPAHQVPVFQVSMPHQLDAAAALRLGATLAPLREQGVVIIGSGSLTHNLHDFRGETDQIAPYALQFSQWIRERVLERDVAALVDYRRQAPQAVRAHPTEDHFLPLLVALGASHATDAPTVIEGGILYGMLSMDSFGWGLGQATFG